MHQVKAPGFGKRRKDLVQRRRKNKGLRGFMHQVRALGFGKSPSVANERSQRNRSVPAIPFHILRITPENAILIRNFVKIKGNDAK